MKLILSSCRLASAQAPVRERSSSSHAPFRFVARPRCVRDKRVKAKAKARQMRRVATKAKNERKAVGTKNERNAAGKRRRRRNMWSSPDSRD